MDITEVALSAVTDEFLSYLRRIDTDENLDQASEFIVVAATLLDLKVAGLLPQGELVDAEDVALLEARDLLFARLLQYRAFKQAAEWFAQHGAAEAAPARPRRCGSSRSTASRRPNSSGRSRPTTSPRSPTLALTPREIPTVGLDHLHAPLVSIREQAAIVVSMLRRGAVADASASSSPASTRRASSSRGSSPSSSCTGTRPISFEQVEPLGELSVRWVAEHWTEENLAALGADYDG